MFPVQAGLLVAASAGLRDPVVDTAVCRGVAWIERTYALCCRAVFHPGLSLFSRIADSIASTVSLSIRTARCFLMYRTQLRGWVT